MAMRILITGVGGFIGSNLVPFLKDRGHFVRGVDISLRKERKKLFNQADELIYLDMRDAKSAILACQTMDYVIHLAADMGGVEYFHKQNYYPFINNMQIDINILQAAEFTKIKRLFYASSACIYPIHLQMEEGNAPKLREDMILPANCDQTYGWEKFMITHLAKHAPFDVRVGILHSVYGPYQETEGERMKFPTSIAVKALHAKKLGVPIEIWGNGKQIRSFCYIDDAMEKIYRVLTDPKYPGAINIGSDDGVTVKEAAEICCEILDILPLDFTYTNDKPSGVLSRNCDNTLFEQVYEYKNKVSTKEGFRGLIEWIQQKDAK